MDAYLKNISGQWAEPKEDEEEDDEDIYFCLGTAVIHPDLHELNRWKCETVQCKYQIVVFYLKHKENLFLDGGTYLTCAKKRVDWATNWVDWVEEVAAGVETCILQTETCNTTKTKAVISHHHLGSLPFLLVVQDSLEVEWQGPSCEIHPAHGHRNITPTLSTNRHFNYYFAS